MTDCLNRSAIYRFGLIFAAVVAVADITNVVGLSPYSVSIKYAYTAALGLLLYHYYSRFASISAQGFGPLLALAFFLATGVGFLANLLRGVEVSYITAFTAPLVFAAAALIPPHRLPVNAAGVCRDFRALFLLASVCYLVEAALKAWGAGSSIFYAPEVEHVKSIVCVMGLSFAILTRRGGSAVLLLAIIVASLAVRPSSTLFVATALCTPLAFALRDGFRRIYSFISWAALALAAATPWLFYLFFDSLADAVTYGESYLKQDILEGHSNTDFRLEIFRLALRKLDGSLLFGEGLSGNPNVDLGAHWLWWHQIVPDGTALIHSDWLVIATQTGIVGSILFFLMFASILRVRLRAVATIAPGQAPETRAILSLSIVGTVAFFLYASFNPVLPLYHIAQIFWFVLFVSEMAAKDLLVPQAAVEAGVRTDTSAAAMPA